MADGTTPDPQTDPLTAIKEFIEKGQYHVPPMARLASLEVRSRRIAYHFLAIADEIGTPPHMAWADVEGDIVDMIESWERRGLTALLEFDEEPF